VTEHAPAAEARPISNHYVPRFVLRRFRTTTLYELDKTTGRIEPRSIENAGQERGLYPDDMETGLFGEMDNAVAQLFRNTLFKNGNLQFDHEARRVISEWLLLFLVRVPQHLEVCKDITNKWNENPANALNCLAEDFELVLSDVRTNMPERYAQAVSQLGEDLLKRSFYELLRTAILDRQADVDSSGRKMFDSMHRSEQERRTYARHLFNLRWTWLTTNREFIIGDNPLCRWDKRNQKPNHGLTLPSVDLTIPLTSKVTLWMHRHYRHADRALCGRDRTELLNRRQCHSALRFVYGPSVASLESVKRSGSH
jgi:hypothetical protein